MVARLILFAFFLSLIVCFLTFSNYQKYFTPEENLSIEHFQKIVEAHKQNSDTHGNPNNAVAVIVADKDDLAIEKGKLIYTEKGQCIDCHGVSGEGRVEEEAPLIAGQHDWYIIDQLQQMKAGKRVNEKMNPYLEKIDENDIQAVAKYINNLRVKE